jgi:hypothetical protein
MWRFLHIVGTTMLLAACGGGGDNSTPPPSGPTPPSALSYQSPETTVVGQAISLSASVSGSVTNYAVSPALPAGLSINTTTGTISGTPASASAKAAYTVTASNSGGSTTFAWVLTVNPAAPTALSYSTPPPFLVGKAIASVTPTVTGTVTSYTVAPALPAGLAIDASAGVISGTPSSVAASATYTVTASNVTGSTTFGFTFRIDPAPTVHLSATATDAQGNPLTYQWKTTDGVLLNVNGAQADWMLPAGPGLHFAYVLVSNGKGGYTERRIAINTDAIGNPAIVPPATTYAAPAAPTPTGDPVRDWFRGYPDSGSPVQRTVFAANISASITDTSGNLLSPSGGMTDARGQLVAPNVAFGTLINASGQGGDVTVSSAISLYRNLPSSSAITGTSTIAGNTPCGISDEFFGLTVTGTVIVLNAAGAAIGSPTSMDEYGGYAASYDPSIVSAKLQCEGGTSVMLAVPGSLNGVDLGFAQFASPAPTVSAISGTYSGMAIGTFLPPPSGLPSDEVPPSDKFLAEKGLDSRLGACEYYRAIGAAQSCDKVGNPSGAISFDDWKRTVKIDAYAPAGGPPTYMASYINVVDLNLTRVHHSIAYGANKVAAYVCNHLGPVDANGNPVTVNLPASSVTPSQQQAVDAAVASAVSGKNLVACVAMDYFVNLNVNAGQPFTRFLIFGPSGQLLPSVNLDGRSEKFVPGTCVACHGGDHYAGKYPEDGTGRADIGAHFLPYDAGNFAFSSTAGLTEADQEAAIYNLNQNVLKAGPNTATSELIAGWYANGATTLNKLYVPTSWQGQGSAAISFYQNVIARSCRTCHVALVESYDFEHFPIGGIPSNAPPNRIYIDPLGDLEDTICQSVDDLPRYNMLRSFSMPNSLVTFNRFWQSGGSTSEADQPAITLQYFQAMAANTAVNINGLVANKTCALAAPPK